MNPSRVKLTERPAVPACGRIAAGCVVLLTTSCIEFGIDPIEGNNRPDQRVTITEEFVQEPLPKVDLLLVVDRTPSMEQELAAMVSALAGLGEQLDEAGVAWQVGLVSTEMDSPEAGWLLGHPWVLTPAGDPGAHLQAILDEVPGSNGEAGLAASIRALELSATDGVNEGFRRGDAALHVVFFSDGDDTSGPWLTNDPVTAVLDRLEVESANGLPARASAVVGDVPGGCTSPFGSATAGTQYVATAEATGGAVISICATDFAPIVQTVSDASIVLQTEFELRDQPAGNAVTVRVDGEVVGAWTLDPAVPSIRFDSPPEAGASVVITYTVRVEG